MTPDQLAAATGATRTRASFWVAPLTAAMTEFNITTPARQAAFLAEIGHESAGLRYTRELGSNAYLDKYDTGRLAARLGNTPADDDDGQKYRGRGLIQITGRTNYAQAGRALGLDLLDDPELLESPELASRSAAWWWSEHGLNALADAGQFDAITHKINGGQNGAEDRRRLWAAAKEALDV